MWRAICLVMMASVSGGCVSPQYNYAPRSVDVSEPPVGSVSTARIGDTMLRQGKYREHDAIFIRAAKNVTWAYTLHPGYYLKDGEDAKGEYFSPGRGEDGGRIEKSFLADPWKSVLARKNKPEICVVTAFNVAACKPAPELERTKRPVLADDTFQQTLIYNGRVGSKINIGYREFSNNTARPAFNNEVEYDLNESTIIGYKGAELEVVEATNQHIKFRLITNFNDAN